MSKTLKIIIAIVVVGLVAVFLVYEFYYNKPHPDYEKEKAAYTLNAREMFRLYNNHPDSANQYYTGKIIKVSGELDKIETTDSLTIGVFVLSSGLFGDEGIRCTMMPKYVKKARNLNTPVQAEIKGLCTGYNDTDIIMEHCSFSYQKE